MIEVIYKEETGEQDTVQEPFAMPRNVRQIGLANGNYRIYVEDYVYTFLSTLSAESKNQGKIAVLTGEIKWTSDMTCIFVKGALAADDMEAAAEHIDFSEEIWKKLQEDKEKYFPDQEIVGWFFAQNQVATEITELFVKVHLRYFGGEKILMLMEPGEREEAFFRYDNGTLVKVNGYYIYYEKNTQMQTYMIERNQNTGPETSEQVEDKAVRNFRKIIDSKKPEEKEAEKTSVFSYAATVCLALAVLATGAAFFQNRQTGTGISEETQTASAVIAQMTPVLTEKAMQTATPAITQVSEEKEQEEKLLKEEPEITGIPTETTAPAEKASESITVTPVPEITKSGQKRSSDSDMENKENTQKKTTEAEQREDNTDNEKKTTQQSEQQTAETAAAAGTPQTYVIRPGDTLYQISLSRYGTVDAMEKICELNGISASEIIYPGQVIVLP